MKPLAFDIETIPDEAKENLLPEPEAAKNIKDPEKVKEDIAKKKAAMISQMGLSPFTGRVCSFAVYGEEKAMQYSSTIKTISDTDEINLLVQIFSLLASVPKDYNIITWNGVNFDFPYIFKRAACLSVPLGNCQALEYWAKKYRRFPHCDLMQELAGWRREECENLDNMGIILLGQGKTERDYMYYVDHIKSGKSKKIGVDNLCDAKITYDLYLKFAPYLFTRGAEQQHFNAY
jgi:DNA polymerase elongation subunit (family B)